MGAWLLRLSRRLDPRQFVLLGPSASRAGAIARRAQLDQLIFKEAEALTDAALAGEPLATLCAQVTRRVAEISGARGAALFARSPGGPQLQASFGEALPDGSEALVAALLQTGEPRPHRGGWLTLPLCARGAEQPVGALLLAAPRVADGALTPLLARAGGVLAAAERQAAKDRFLSLAAHELKTPLTSIKGFSYSLARRMEKGQACDPRTVAILERQAERLHGLLEEMLEVSRLETGRFSLHPEPCELGELLESVSRALRRLGVEPLQADATAHKDLLLHVDRERVERALIALTLQARAFAESVLLNITREPSHARLRLSWPGNPLPAEELQRLLQPRWEEASPSRQGLGMALWIAERAIHLHGGALIVREREFVLELPLPQEGEGLHEEAPPDSPLAPPPSTR